MDERVETARTMHVDSLSIYNYC